MKKYLAKLSLINSRTGFKNFLNSFRVDYKQEIREGQNDLQLLHHKLHLLRLELLYFKVIDFFKRNPNVDYLEEVNYLREIGGIALFPYRLRRRLEPFICEVDPVNKMPYVLHKGIKKLFFPKEWDVETVRANYLSLVEEQGILGGGYSDKTPHQYQTDDFCVKESDIVLDIGSAEALFALEVVDVVKKVFVFEYDPIWKAPLQATFEPYKNKVVIINKFVADIDSENQIRLDTCLKFESYESLFLKLDIEGSEKVVLTGNKDLLVQSANVRIACCTYHEHNDASYLENLLQGLGYHTEFSDGYMIYVHDEQIKPPYFRQGLIRAWNNQEK